MMAQGNHHRRLITTWNGLSNPHRKKPRRRRLPPGASEAWVLVWRGTDPPRRYRITTSRPRYGDTAGNR